MNEEEIKALIESTMAGIVSSTVEATVAKMNESAKVDATENVEADESKAVSAMYATAVQAGKITAQNVTVAKTVMGCGLEVFTNYVGSLETQIKDAPSTPGPGRDASEGMDAYLETCKFFGVSDENANTFKDATGMFLVNNAIAKGKEIIPIAQAPVAERVTRIKEDTGYMGNHLSGCIREAGR